jgi:ComF family protein
MAFVCPRCASPAGPFADLKTGCAECRTRSLGFDRAIAFGVYEGDLHDLCLRIKHERNAWLAPYMGKLLAEFRHSELGQVTSNSCIVPIPLHWWRHYQRGYNQAESIAEGLGRQLKLPVYNALKRRRVTKLLAQSTKTERAIIMHDAFRARRRLNLTGRTVFLVDDILTTGATADNAARALKQAGATSVTVVVIGRTQRQAL